MIQRQAKSPKHQEHDIWSGVESAMGREVGEEDRKFSWPKSCKALYELGRSFVFI